MKRTSDILKDQGSLSQQEISDYLSGKLKGESLKAVEKKIASNEMNLEAIEIYSKNPALLKNVPAKPDFLSGKGGTVNYYKIYFGITAIISVLAITGIVYLIQNKEQKQPELLAVKESPEKAQPAEKIENEIKEIEAAEPIEEKEQITYQKTLKDQPQTIPTPVEITDNNNTSINKVEEKKVVDLSPDPEEKVAHSNVKFTFMHDLKVIDYSDLYTSDIKKTEILLTGTPANVGDNTTPRNNEPETRTVLIPYEKFLKETMEEFSNNRYKSALKNFTLILQQYPEDLNASFYGGLCYYNLGKFDKAITNFNRCINHSFSTFSEEAEWYKALSLMKSGNKAEANALLEEIIQQNGFYAKKAQEIKKN